MEWFQEGHVAIVTGGTRGLGKELARELLAKGLLVIIDGRDAVELERARKELADVGHCRYCRRCLRPRITRTT
jgi:NAD(P)-dependent dehydrogenase (short-subunit alcohol dehydrogenase family)